MVLIRVWSNEDKNEVIACKLRCLYIRGNATYSDPSSQWPALGPRSLATMERNLFRWINVWQNETTIGSKISSQIVSCSSLKIDAYFIENGLPSRKYRRYFNRKRLSFPIQVSMLIFLWQTTIPIDICDGQKNVIDISGILIVYLLSCSDNFNWCLWNWFQTLENAMNAVIKTERTLFWIPKIFVLRVCINSFCDFVQFERNLMSSRFGFFLWQTMEFSKTF